MKNKLIHFLGGISKIEHQFLKLEYDNQRDLAVAQRRQISYLETRLSEAETERKNLQEIIFKRFGVIFPEESGTTQENLNPIRTTPRRWSQLRSALEADDRARVKEVSNAQIP